MTIYKLFLLGAFGAVLASLSQPLRAADDLKLNIGDPAPALTVGEWLKGEPVKEFDKDKIYVLEFWATWCGPCLEAMPRLTELQEKYKDKSVVIIGVNVSEPDQDLVAPFVKKQDKKMGYRVVRDDVSADDELGKMEANWLEAAEQSGIPTTIVVNQEGKLAWIGHPEKLGGVLEKVVAKNWDIVKAKEEFVAEVKKERAIAAVAEKLKAAIENQESDAALAAVDEMVKLEPESAKSANFLKFNVLLEMDECDKAYALGDKLLEEHKDDSEVLNEISWSILDTEDLSKRDFDLALKIAVRANEVAKGGAPEILDTLARAHFEKGDVQQAVDFQAKAVEKADPTDRKLKRELEQTLRKYQAKKAL